MHLPGSPSARGYEYDGNSNLTRISETNGAQTVAVESVYDAFDRPTQMTDANARIWTQVFDAADQRRSLSSAGVPQVQWNYDLGGRPDQITISGAGTYTLVYDKADRNTQIQHPNGVTTSHEFDDASRIREIEHSRAGVIARFQYDYDDNGNRIEQTEENGAAPITTTFVYDKADRLTTISEPGKHTVYTLDGNSNRIATTEGPSAGQVTRRFTAEFDARNQIVEQQQFDSGNSLIGTVEFEFDLNGNLIGQASGSAVTEWRYDALDRLIETTPPTGPPTQYRYGPGDVRISKVRAGEEIRYHYDGERLVLETNAIGNPQKHYAYTAAGLLNTATLGVTPEYRSAHLDAQTSPIAITSSTGNILNRSRFDAYGVETSLFGIRDQAISFQGYWSGTELEENGQLLSAARIYIPGLGIFGERDPVEGIANEPAGFNAYVIGPSNPHYWMDPDGRMPLLLAAAAETGGGIAARKYGAIALKWTVRVIGGAALALLGGNELDYYHERALNREIADRVASGQLPRSRVVLPHQVQTHIVANMFAAEPRRPEVYTTPAQTLAVPTHTAGPHPERPRAIPGLIPPDTPREVLTGVLPGRQAEPDIPTIYTTPPLQESERGPNALIYVPSLLPQQLMLSQAQNTGSSSGGTPANAGSASNSFPATPEEMTKILGVEPTKVSTTIDGTQRVVWEPNSNTRIRFESHPEGLKPGDAGYNPRHHGEHYHIEAKPDGMSWNQASKKGQITKVKPDGYAPGVGTGFFPGEKFPGSK